MGIMIIFLILSIVLVIVTAIYLKFNNEKVNIKLKTNNEEKPKNNRKTKKQLSDILQIKFIKDMIYLKNRYSKVLELGSVDYNMLSEQEQENIENILMQTALSVNYPLQLFSTTEFIDTSKIVNTMKKNESKNLQVQEYKNAMINYLENLEENRSISIIKNYAIISYDGNLKEAENELNRKIVSLKNSLLRAKISCKVLNESEIYNLIYRELNKNSFYKIDNLDIKGENLYVSKKEKSQ